MTTDIKEIIKSSEYDFLRTDERLKSNIMLLTFGGSYSYGTNHENSDIDIRGVVMPTARDIYGSHSFLQAEDEQNKNLIFGPAGFEQYNHSETDTVIYSLNKIFDLLYKCNPNTIEILGCKPEHYAAISHGGQLLLDNAELFLSKKAYRSFSGYATDQFRRLKNALERDRVGIVEKYLSLIDRIDRMNDEFERKFPTYNRNMLKFYITNKKGQKAYYDGMELQSIKINYYYYDEYWRFTNQDGRELDLTDAEVRIDLALNGLSFDDAKFVFNEVSNTVKDFNKHLGHRNEKKDDYHLNKHAMHLVRLYLMCFDILEKHKIITHRGGDLDLLLSILHGEYMLEDGRYSVKFYEMIEGFNLKLAKLLETTTLPDEPDRVSLNKLLMEIYSIELGL